MIRTLFRSLAGTALLSLSLLAAAPVRAADAPPAFTVEVTGHGKPMILIPGLASSGEVWRATVERYAKQYECHVLTLAGFAGNAPIDGPLLPAVERRLHDYIAEKKLDHPVVVGHSLGGVLAMKLAADHPESVGRLVVVDSLPALGATQVPSLTPAQLEDNAARMRAMLLGLDDATYRANQLRNVASMVTAPQDRERVIAWGRASDRKAVAEGMYEVMAADLRQDIARIQAPTLVLGTWVAFREFAPKSAIESTFRTQYAKLSNARIEIADNARHFIMYDDPQWMFAQLDRFLQ